MMSTGHITALCADYVSSICGGLDVQLTDATTMVVDKVKYITTVVAYICYEFHLNKQK